MERKIRNIRLVSIKDESYKAFCREKRLERLHLRKPNEKTEIEKLSFSCEIAVRDWLLHSGIDLEKRIIGYEELQSTNRYIEKYRELDATFFDNDELWIVEVKLTTRTTLKHTGLKQIKKSKELLSRLYDKINCLVITIFVAHKHLEAPIQSFNYNFKNHIFENKWYDGELVNILDIPSREIFFFGLDYWREQHISMYRSALLECEQLIQEKKERQILKDEGVPYEDFPEYLKSKPKGESKDNILKGVSDTKNTTLGDFLDDLDLSK